MQECIEEMSSLGFLADAGAHEHLVALLYDIHRLTWASFEGCPEVWQTTCGCSAGNPLADLCFAIGFRKFIIRFRRRITDLGLMPTCVAEHVAGFFGLDETTR